MCIRDRCESPFIIADEPTTDLDVVAQARILDLLESIMQKQAPGMLLVTHDMGVVARLADDVAVMSQGKIVEQGDVETLFNAPKHTVTRSLVSAHLALYGCLLYTSRCESVDYSAQNAFCKGRGALQTA